ncbi:hypothetical protein LCGC14_1695090 [marine sediment metagenome]|uniref:Uncharacterized protein n=1 Tax=marine sediment metagenome TaxID=412755 RepID=A0A0F9I799_9ZZZZ
MATFRCNNYPSFGFNTPDGVGYYFERGRFCTDDLPDEVAELVEKTLRSLLGYGVDIFEDGIDYGSKAVQEVEEAESTLPTFTTEVESAEEAVEIPPPNTPEVVAEALARQEAEDVGPRETQEGEDEFAFLEGKAPLGAGPGPEGSGIPEGSELADDS